MGNGVVSGNTQPVSSGLRAYFAPVQRDTEQVAALNLATLGGFDLAGGPPVPWIDAGWVDALRRSSETKFGTARRGKRTARVAQYRTQLDAHIEVEFRDWGKMQMALSAGSEHFNVLAAGAAGSTVPAAPVLAGSTATEIRMNAADIGNFAVGDQVAVDIDYQQQCGYLGTGIAGTYVANTDVLPIDADFVRRVTFNVARITSMHEGVVSLDHPLPGGAPGTAASVQKVVGFTDREGGKFIQEWSALFVLSEVSGGRICLYYPRLQPATGSSETQIELAAGLKLNSLKASFIAMPYSDPIDGEPVLCYRSYIPASVATQ